jgi:pimeloyl-ACP methyl ester carboxylesterase
MIETCEKFVGVDDLHLWTESFGDANRPAVLLIMGGMHQGIMWPDEFCTEIAQDGYYVIRYDHRDTGQSSSVDFTKHPYSLDDLARDALMILDGYGIQEAHLVGISMGGFLAQLLALDFPDRVLTLTLMMTSPDQRVYFAATMGKDTSRYELPAPSQEFLEHLASARRNPPKTTDEAILNAVDGWRICNGNGVPFDAESMYRLQQRPWARAKTPSAAINHVLATVGSPGRTERLGRITVPTLVIHGQHDPCLPIEHGFALAKAVPKAKLVVIPEMGHLWPLSLCEQVARMVLEHINPMPHVQAPCRNSMEKSQSRQGRAAGNPA